MLPSTGFGSGSIFASSLFWMPFFWNYLGSPFRIFVQLCGLLFVIVKLGFVRYFCAIIWEGRRCRLVGATGRVFQRRPTGEVIDFSCREYQAHYRGLGGGAAPPCSRIGIIPGKRIISFQEFWKDNFSGFGDPMGKIHKKYCNYTHICIQEPKGGTVPPCPKFE